jgi:hypothetical protein
MGEKDQWDSSAQESPPLLPGKAIRLAKEFMQRFPPPPGTRWQVEQVKLLRYAGSEDEEHEQWLYVVVFNYKIPGRGRQMPRSDIEVPVRMDGTIPEPESSNEPSSPQQAPKAP